MDLSGQQLGPYLLKQLLGSGGMGSVYESYQQTVKRRVAVKVLPAELGKQAEYVARFTREVELVARLEHPRIVPIHDYGIDRGISYVVMRLLTGGTLTDRVRQAGMLRIDEVMAILQAIGEALDYAHQKGVVHRDLKPSNIMFDEANNAYLVDFGIAKALAATHHLTHTGTVMGTPAFMAPEQWQGEEVDARTDIYALGVIAYHLLTGSFPFEADTPIALGHQHVSRQHTPPTLIKPDLPSGVDAVMARVLAKRREDRFASAGQFVAALKAVFRHQAFDEQTYLKPDLLTPASGHYQPPANAAGKKRRAGWMPVALVLAVLLIAGGLYLVFSSLTNDGDDAADVTVNRATSTLPALPTMTRVESAGIAAAASETESAPTATETLEIALMVASLDAQATFDQATVAAQQRTGAAAATSLSATQVALDATATADQWTDTPTPNITASIDAYRTQQAATVTQSWIDSWTPTPPPTATPTPVGAQYQLLWIDDCDPLTDADHCGYVDDLDEITPFYEIIESVDAELVYAVPRQRSELDQYDLIFVNFCSAALTRDIIDWLDDYIKAGGTAIIISEMNCAYSATDAHRLVNQYGIQFTYLADGRSRWATPTRYHPIIQNVYSLVANQSAYLEVSGAAQPLLSLVDDPYVGLYQLDGTVVVMPEFALIREPDLQDVAFITNDAETYLPEIRAQFRTFWTQLLTWWIQQPTRETDCFVTSTTTDMYTEPSLSADHFGQLRSDQQVGVIAQADQAGVRWWQLSGNHWVRSHDVLLSGDCSGIPRAIPAPTLIAPDDGSVFDIYPRTTTLEWEPVEGATAYVVEIHYGYDGIWFYDKSVVVEATTYTFDFVGAQPGRWRVQAINNAGVPGLKSEWWEFTYTI